MRRLTTILLAGILLFASIAYAGNGDLIVDHKVGIGNDAPQASLDLGGVNRSSDYHVSFLWYNDNNSGPYAGTKGGIYLDQWGLPNNTTVVFPTAADNPGTFIVATKDTGGTSLVERMRIQGQTGNVGIGTTAPSTMLEVDGTITQWDGYDKTTLAQTGWGGSHGLVFGATRTQTYVPGDFMVPGQFKYALDAGPYSYGAGGIVYIANGGEMMFVISPASTGAGNDINWGTPVMSLTRAGMVGIGTITPAYKLDVQGQVASNGVILTSDSKFKKNLQTITSPLDKALRLTGQSYEWKTNEYKEKNFPEGRHYGVIAQEVEKVLPEVVNTDAKGEKSVAYTEIIPVLIEAIKEQQKLIEKQQKLLETQQAELLEIRTLLRKR